MKGYKAEQVKRRLGSYCLCVHAVLLTDVNGTSFSAMFSACILGGGRLSTDSGIWLEDPDPGASTC